MQFRNIRRCYLLNKALHTMRRKHPDLPRLTMVETFALYLLAEHPQRPLRNGTFAIEQNRNKRENNTYILTLLRRHGMIESTPIGRYNYFSLTPAGTHYLTTLERYIRTARIDK